MKQMITAAAMAILILLTAGCGTNKKEPVSGTNYYYPKQESSETVQTDSESTEKIEAVFESDVYMIISNDMAAEQMEIKQMASGSASIQHYALTTRFLDKYGHHTSVTEFYPGRMITLGDKDTKGRLKEVRLTDVVWEYEDVVRFAIDEERKVFRIADTNYTYDENLFVVSNGERIHLADIKEEDELRIVGMNKEILSVSVTTGQGSLSLINTELFEGSFIQIGRKIFAEITGEITLEVPEGAYTVTVANKGYGGSKEIEIVRDEELVLDLNELKGEGPKKGLISFVITDKDGEELGAVLKLDGKEVSYEDEIELDFGLHGIQVSCFGFEKLDKKLFVNSENATITITLSEEKAAQVTSSEKEETDSENSNLAGSLAGSTHTATDSSSGNNSLSDDEMSDYLSTFTELLGNVIN